MHDDFVQEFCSELLGTIPGEYIPVVSEQLSMFLTGYDIRKKETGVVAWTGSVPQEVGKYLTTLRISGSSERTIEDYKLQLQNFFKATGKDAKTTTSDDVLLYFATYKTKRKVKPITLEHYRIILNTFFEWCVSEEIISRNPCKKMHPVKYWKTREEILTDFQIESIRQSCKTKRDLAIVDFFLSTGCRVTELASMLVSDVDFENGKATVLGKGNKPRTVYINGRAMHSLTEYLSDRKNSTVLFCSERKPYGAMSKEGIEKIVRELGKKSNVPNLHPHLFRKTMSTNAVRRGMEITTVQRILGHESIETTMRYVNVGQEEIENSHRRFVA